MKILAITLKSIKETLRNIKSTAIIFILPVAFMGLFAFIFSSEPMEYQYTVGFVPAEITEFKKIVDKVKDVKTPKGKARFEVIELKDETAAKESIIKNDAKAVLVWKNNGLVLLGDRTNSDFGVVAGNLTQTISEYFATQYPQAQPSTPQPELFRVETFDSGTRENYTGFQYVVPGLIIYGILMLIAYVTQILAQLVEKKELFRYFTSRTSALEIFSGYTLFFMIFGLFQTAFLFLAAYALGFRPAGDVWPAFVVAIPTVLFTIGVGLLLGSFVKKPSEAAGLATLATIALGFLSGSFLQFPEIKIIPDLFGRSWSLTDLIPTAQASEALRSILIFGQNISTVWFEIGYTSVVSVLVFLLGVWLYNQRRLKNLEF